MDEELIFLILIGVTLWMFFRTRSLFRRVDHMEQYLQSVTKSLQRAETGSPVATVQDTQKEFDMRQEQAVMQAGTEELLKTVREPVYPTQSLEPSVFERFFTWLSTDWLMKMGGFLLILGVAWFVNYAFAENWVGPMGRIAIGLMVGAGILATGRYRMISFVSQGGILMFVGALIVTFTVWVGQTPVYGFFTEVSSLSVIFLTASVLGITSVFYARKPLAYANVALSAVAPLFVTDIGFDMVTLLTYLLVLTLGAVWVAAVTGWRELVLGSLGIVYLYSLSFLDHYYYYSNDIDTGLLFCFVFTALFFIVSIVGMLKNRQENLSDVLTAVVSGLYLLTWVTVGAAEEWQSLILVAWTLVFAFGAFFAFRLGAHLRFFFTYVGVGVVLLGVATAIEVEGPALTIAYIFEAALLLVAGWQLTRNARSLLILAIPALVPLMMSFESIDSRAWREGVLHADGAVLYVLLSVLVLLGMYFHTQRLLVGEGDRDKVRLVRNVSYALAGFYATVLVWLVSTGLIPQDGGSMVALFVYTITALSFYLLGKQSQQKWESVVGTIFFVIVLGRLLLVEVWDMELFFRVITFVVIGLLIIFVAWMQKNSSTKQVTRNHA
jgi:Predicted membrane protein (DUF2339)